MVKKKKVKKSKRKTRVRAVKKTPSQVQQDMELFAKGVERLKELKQELVSLDTKGFYKEEQSIKSKLKNVSDVPAIEKEMKQLRLKIDKKYKPKKRRRVSKIGKELGELKKSLERREGQKLIKNVEELKREIASRKGQALREDFKSLREDETRKGRALKEDIEELKEGFVSKRRQALKKDFEILRKEVASRKGRALKEDIDELKEDVSKVSGLKTEVRKLREEIEKKRKRRAPRKMAFKIDTEIGFLVEKDFDAFVKDIEGKLSERVNEKEASFDDALKRDLEKRQRNFVLKYETLINRFNMKKEKLEKEIKDKYNLQVETSLKKEVDEKFNQTLESRLHKERGKLVEEYKALLNENVKKQVEEQRRSLRKKFEGEFSKKLKSLQEDFSREVKSAQKEEETEKSLLKKQEQKNIDALKKLKDEKKKIEEKEKKMDELKKKLVEDSHKQLSIEIDRKQKILETQMRNEFKLKLDKQVQEHEALLKKKKSDLELEVEKKIKQILN